MRRFVLVFAVVVAVASAPRVARADQRNFAAGSLIIPMDLAYQDQGLFQAYGLLFQLLRQGVPVAWVIDPAKTWHAAPCNTAGNLCAWDCAIEGSGTKCNYPTASPDFFVASTVVAGPGMGTAISNHGYRGGPFVIAAANKAAALPIIAAWNDMAMWTAAPWARRTVFHPVAVHEATAAFSGFVAKDMLAAPTIAVFSDGNEDIATSYLRAAGIPQSSGAEFPVGKCGAANCGPGTANPDMLTVPSVAGDMGTCAAPSSNHKNGALFTTSGVPAYCQIMSMHWDVNDRETVQCGGANCPGTQAACGNTPITYHGHEVVAEVRSFLKYPVHFFAECQAVNAYENTTPNPAWPYLDDSGRDGHFLTTRGMPPACPCQAGFSCVIGGCAGADCCQPTNVKEKGAGFLIAAQPASSTLKVLRPNVAYNQMDGEFQTTGGSEPAYNLSTYLMTMYKNNREVTFITGPNGPGSQDIWMTGYADGSCDIGTGEVFLPGGGGACGTGKVSYLGGHDYKTGVPLSGNGDSQGTRLFLNALFEADCVTSAGQPRMSLSLGGELEVRTRSLPVQRDYAAGYGNSGKGAALDAVLNLDVPATLSIAAAPGATLTATRAGWAIGAISGLPVLAGDPPASGSRAATLRFTAYGDYQVAVGMSYRVGLSTLSAPPQMLTIRVIDADPLPDGGAGGDGGGGDGGGIVDGGDDGGCGCRTGADAGAGTRAPWLGVLAVGVLLVWRRRTQRR